MINFSDKGIFNQQSLTKNDPNNIANGDNHTIFSQIILGNEESEMFSYLLNLGHQRLSDFKSMMFYNEEKVALKMNEAQIFNEITNGSDVIQLSSKFKLPRTHFSDILEHRKSTRSFSKVTMSEADFSNILHYSFGIANREVTYGDIKTSTRHYPSGGGLYPVKTIIYVNEVEEVPSGFYEYQPVSHSLLSLQVQDNIDLNQFFNGGNIDTINSSFITFFAYSIDSTYLKYGELSLLTTLIEIGLMTQNFDLILTSLGYTGCPLASFNKTIIENYLNYDHVNTHILFSDICGKE